MKDLFKKLLSSNEETSSLRAVFLLCGFLFIPAFVGVWTYVGFKWANVPDVPSGVVALLATLLVGKGLNKAAEAYSNSVKNKEGDKS